MNSGFSPIRILLVEDDEHDRLAFRRTFKKSHMVVEITECDRAEDALQRLSVEPSVFDLVVVDHQLPGMSGLHLCKKLIAENLSSPLVILTGKGSQHLAVDTAVRVNATYGAEGGSNHKILCQFTVRPGTGALSSAAPGASCPCRRLRLSPFMSQSVVSLSVV